MIQKKTWILVLIFFIFLALVFLVEKTPALTAGLITPTPTDFLKFLPDLPSTDIVKIDIKNESAPLNFGLERTTQGIWDFSLGQNFQVDQGKVQILLSNLVSLEILHTLEPALSLDQFGLDSPKHSITLQNVSGEKKVINIGNETPTGSGYYVQLNNSSPTVISKNGLEGIMQILTPERLSLQIPALQLPPGVQPAP